MDNLIITIPTGSKEEKKQALIKACAAALRWYAENGNKHHGDDECAVEIAEMIEEINELEKAPS
jgi:phosphosulfolactate synthase (CoM biosynthesis protein A)